MGQVEGCPSCPYPHGQPHLGTLAPTWGCWQPAGPARRPECKAATQRGLAAAPGLQTAAIPPDGRWKAKKKKNALEGGGLIWGAGGVKFI